MWSEYAADDPGRPGEPGDRATQGLAPAAAPGLDPVELVVDGQRFVVTRRGEAAGTYDFDWVNHPASYGFTVGASVDWRPDQAEMTEQIRSFLAEVDPETGYLSTDPRDDPALATLRVTIGTRDKRADRGESAMRVRR